MPTTTAAFEPGLKEVPPIELREIDINVTNLCNLECIYCSYSSTPGKNEPALAGSVLHPLLDQAAALGTRVIHFSGGEPVIRRDMPELIAHGADLGFRMRMHSNGALLSERKLHDLWNAGLRRVLVSLDGLAEDHDYHRAQPGLYSKTIQGIRNAVAAGFNVRVNSVATTRNIHNIPSLLPLVAELGAATFSVFYLIPIGRGRDVRELMVSPGRWRAFIDQMRKVALIHRPENLEVAVEKVFSWSDEWDREDATTGRGGTCLGFLKKCNYVNILADGRVYPCVCFIDEAPPLGNIHDRPLAEILHDPASWTFYRAMEHVNPTCASCELLPQCGGGCRSLSRVTSRDWFALDPRCSGDPKAQGYIPLCFMMRENISTGSRSGFAERVQDGA